MSAETVQDIILWVYKTGLRLQYALLEVLSWSDVKLTFKILLCTSVTIVYSYFFRDSLTLWTISNLLLLYPLGLKYKRAEFEKIVGLINHKLDTFVY